MADDDNTEAPDEQAPEEQTSEQDVAEQETSEQDASEQETSEQDASEQETSEQDTSDEQESSGHKRDDDGSAEVSAEDERRAVEDKLNPKDDEGSSINSEATLKAATGLGFITGLAFFFYGVYLMFAGDKAWPFVAAMLLAGSVAALMAWYSLNKSRIAWSFALSLHGVGAVVFLFGAPKVRDGADLHMGIAMIPCLILSVTAILYALSSEQFE